MNDHNELTYYEYWLTKKVWNASNAIQLIADYIKFKRPWESHENYFNFVNTIKNEIKTQLFEEKANHVFTLRTVSVDDGYDEITGQWIEKELDIDESDVKPKEFIEWVHSKGYQIPYEFKVFIGVEAKDPIINQKQHDYIDKLVVQAIGKTLWDEHPDMTIEDMQYHKAIQLYGAGRLHSSDSTLRRWLSAVDTRKNKRGPKKQH